MRLIPFALAAAGLLAACGDLATGPTPTPGTGAPTPSDVAGAAIPPRSDAQTYLCANGAVVQVRYPDDDVEDMNSRVADVYIDGRYFSMIRGASAQGERYIGGGWQWVAQGRATGNLAPLGPGESSASSPGTECRSGG